MQRDRWLQAVGLGLAWCYWLATAPGARAEPVAQEALRPVPLQDSLRDAVARATATIPGRVEVEFPPHEMPLVLQGCRRFEPFVPEGARLWGRSALGVRCVDGGVGMAYVPVRIQVFAPALVATRALPPGQALAADDLQVAEIDLTAQPGPVLSEPGQAVGRVLARPVAAGAAVRADALRIRSVIAAGDLVRIVYEGEGFSISADGKALASAQEGQSVRVQTEGGRLLTGTARNGRKVEIRGF